MTTAAAKVEAAEVKAEIQAQPGIRTTRTLAQATGAGFATTLIRFAWQKAFHEELDVDVALAMVVVLTGFASWVQNVVERRQKLDALKAGVKP